MDIVNQVIRLFAWYCVFALLSFLRLLRGKFNLSNDGSEQEWFIARLCFSLASAFLLFGPTYYFSNILVQQGYPFWIREVFFIPSLLLSTALVTTVFICKDKTCPPGIKYSIKALLGGMFGVGILLTVIVRPLVTQINSLHKVHSTIEVTVVEVVVVGDGISLVCDDGSDYLLEGRTAPEPGRLKLGATRSGQIIQAVPVNH